ncbi:MAG: TRAP transporter small permease [Spirochaetales bacterium]|nr:TRAP transporter small permease [Spirochaetales bacterium]
MLKRIYETFEEYFTCVFFILIFLLLVIGVILRSIFSIAFAWNIELSRYSFVWLTFIGAAYVRRNDGHIKIDLFANYIRKKLPRAGCVLYWLVTKFVSMVYLALLVYFSYLLSTRTWAFKSQAMQIPQSFLYISVGIGSLLYLIREIVDSILRFKRGDF